MLLYVLRSAIFDANQITEKYTKLVAAAVNVNEKFVGALSVPLKYPGKISLEPNYFVIIKYPSKEINIDVDQILDDGIYSSATDNNIRNNVFPFSHYRASLFCNGFRFSIENTSISESDYERLLRFEDSFVRTAKSEIQSSIGKPESSIVQGLLGRDLENFKDFLLIDFHPSTWLTPNLQVGETFDPNVFFFIHQGHTQTKFNRIGGGFRVFTALLHLILSISPSSKNSIAKESTDLYPLRRLALMTVKSMIKIFREELQKSVAFILRLSSNAELIMKCKNTLESEKWDGLGLIEK